MLRALLDAGAAPIGDARECHAVAIDGRAPKFDGGIVTRLDCVPLGIVVDRDGERFYDEGEDVWPKRYAIWGKLVATRPGQIAYAIVDAKVRGLFMPSAYPAIEASSIRGLAAQLELPVEPLEATVAAFNQAVQPGSFDHTALDDCRTAGLSPEKTHWAQRLDTPPYAAYPLRPGITFTYLSVRVDSEARGEERRAVRERLRRRRDHGRQRAAERLYCRHRHDDRHGVRADCGRERSATCKQLS
jgi:tricarballylate dehydrogenase